MTLTECQIVEAIAEANGFNVEKATETIEILLELIKSTLAFGDDVLIRCLDKFVLRTCGSNEDDIRQAAGT
jgi:integration host factor subunit alpha